MIASRPVSVGQTSSQRQQTDPAGAGKKEGHRSVMAMA